MGNISPCRCSGVSYYEYVNNEAPTETSKTSTDLALSTVEITYGDDDDGMTPVRVEFSSAHDSRDAVSLRAFFGDLEGAPSPDAWLVGDSKVEQAIVQAIAARDTSVVVSAPVQAEEMPDGWVAVDDGGSRFWPADQDAIASSDDPEQATLAAAEACNGEWRQ